MHGIPKQKERTKKELEKIEKQCCIYQNLCTEIYNKKLSIIDLGNIGDALNISPENSTLWNLRKEIITDFINQNEHERDIFINELSFNAVCLSHNPKSYATWYHRKWCLKQMSYDAPIKEELDICKEYLGRDERNFHCWAYWYFLTKDIPHNTKMAFVTEKLIENFSNYSAWHYRSMLFEKENEFCSAGERELLHNAFYTDPDDQSAWFYHRWILQKTATPVRAVLTHLDDFKNLIVVVFSKPVNLESDNWSRVVNTSTSTGDIRNCIWKKHVNGNRTITINSLRMSIECAKSREEENEIKLLRRLLEMQPECKWVHLALFTLLSRQDIQNFDKLEQHLDSLVQMDALRKNFYEDTRSLVRIKETISKMEKRTSAVIIQKPLTRLYEMQYFYMVSKLDLCKCKNLRSLSGIEMCQHLEILNASHNKIEHAPTQLAKCPKLRHCDLRDNPLSDEQQDILTNCLPSSVELIFNFIL